jgi:hypothetical protein
MKKLVLISIFFTIALSLSAQDYRTSLGVRGGLPSGLTIKHFLNKNNALEGIMALSYGGFVVTGLYEFEKWTGIYPSLNWYIGAGAYAGFWDAGDNPNLPDTFTGSVIGIGLVGGLEYTFDEIPLNLALDILPTFNLAGTSGWGGMSGGLSIRYVF